jgi:hypothetical protein
MRQASTADTTLHNGSPVISGARETLLLTIDAQAGAYAMSSQAASVSRSDYQMASTTGTSAQQEAVTQHNESLSTGTTYDGI